MLHGDEDQEPPYLCCGMHCVALLCVRAEMVSCRMSPAGRRRQSQQHSECIYGRASRVANCKKAKVLQPRERAERVLLMLFIQRRRSARVATLSILVKWRRRWQCPGEQPASTTVSRNPLSWCATQRHSASIRFTANCALNLAPLFL